MSALEYTPLKEIEVIHDDLVKGYGTGKTKSIAFRKHQLLQLAYLVQDNIARFEEALKADLGRPGLESQFLEILPTVGDAKNAYANVEKWAKPEKPAFSFNFAPMRPVIRKESKGVVLIISPFNYPLWLSIQPAASAIAAGNSVLLKPSEKTPATSALMAELIPKYIDPDIFRVVNGAVAETTRLLELKWDHIFYTGGSQVAKIVAAAAAKTLTPVSLELGGKCPVIIDPKCDLETATRRIFWGKIVNAGQTCVAPDYVLVPKDFQDTFVDALNAQHKKFYPEANTPTTEGSFGSLVNPAAFSRVEALIKASNGTIVVGGETTAESKYISPTIVKDVKGNDSLMSEEIFGPVLPIVPVKDVDEAIEFVNARDHPLALYVFSRDPEFKRKVFDNTKSGAAVANETVIHPGADGLPFGGIGPSGMGYSTGKFGFDTFTHLRASLDSPGWLDHILGMRYPPYTADKKLAVMKFLSQRLPSRPAGAPQFATTITKRWGKWFLLGFALAMVGLLINRRFRP